MRRAMAVADLGQGLREMVRVTGPDLISALLLVYILARARRASDVPAAFTFSMIPLACGSTTWAPSPK